MTNPTNKDPDRELVMSHPRVVAQMPEEVLSRAALSRVADGLNAKHLPFHVEGLKAQRAENGEVKIFAQITAVNEAGPNVADLATQAIGEALASGLAQETPPVTLAAGVVVAKVTSGAGR